MNRIDFDLFDEMFGVVMQDEENRIWYIDDFSDKRLKELDRRYLWTMVECDGVTSIIPGVHWVNRLAYVITEKPWTDTMDKLGLDVVIGDDDDDRGRLYDEIYDRYFNGTESFSVPEGDDDLSIGVNLAYLQRALRDDMPLRIDEGNRCFWEKLNKWFGDSDVFTTYANDVEDANV